MSTARRFVLLRHTGHGATHFDFMIEDGDKLATWQFDQSPTPLKPGSALPCRRLADHRAAYLDYEGPVSGGRGNVCREDAGTCQVMAATADHWAVALHGTQLRDGFTLTQHAAGTWHLTRALPPHQSS